MQRDKHYVLVGAFVILTILAVAGFSTWLVGTQDKDKYQVYRIRFAESVSGLALGSPVKYRGVDVGKVKEMSIDPDDITYIRVDANILKSAPIKTDTVATLKLLGITGNVYIELSGSQPGSPNLLTSENRESPPEIPSQPSTISTVMDMLPQITEKISNISDQLSKLLSNKNIASISDTIKQLNATSHNAAEASQNIKEHPSRLIFGGHDKKDDKKQPQQEPPLKKYPD